MRIKEIKDDETKDTDDRLWIPEKIKEDIIVNKKREEIILNKISKLIHTSFFMINCREYRNELASKFNKLTDMEIEYLREKAKDLNGTIPLELNKLKEKTTYVDKIYKILDEFNAKIDYIQLEQKMNLVRGSIQLDKKKEQLAEEQIQNINELIENINELEANIKELVKYKRKQNRIS